MLKKVAFTLYPVTDMAAARGFYERTLGLSSETGEKSPWVEYDLPGGGCFAITTVMSDAPSANAGGTIAFEVDNLEELVADLRAKGVRLGHHELVKGPHCRMMTTFDPDGNSLILHQLDDPS